MIFVHFSSIKNLTKSKTLHKIKKIITKTKEWHVRMKLCRFSVFFEILVSRRKFDVPSISIAPIPCTEPPNHPTQCKNRDSSGPKN